MPAVVPVVMPAVVLALVLTLRVETICAGRDKMRTQEQAPG